MRSHLSKALALLCLTTLGTSAAMAASLSGRVSLYSTPLAGVEVAVTQTDGKVVNTLTTANDGHYRFELADGRYELMLHPPLGSGLSTTRATGIVIQGGDLTRDVVLIGPALTEGFGGSGEVTDSTTAGEAPAGPAPQLRSDQPQQGVNEPLEKISLAADETMAALDPDLTAENGAAGSDAQTSERVEQQAVSLNVVPQASTGAVEPRGLPWRGNRARSGSCGCDPGMEPRLYGICLKNSCPHLYPQFLERQYRSQRGNPGNATLLTWDQGSWDQANWN